MSIFREIQEVIDGLVEQVALVSCDGTILAVNECWRRQVERQARTGLRISRDYIAFLEGLIEDGDEGVKPILRAFRDISTGSTAYFSTSIQGRGAFDGYDFTIVVAPLTIHGTRHVLVSVHDVTELVGLKRQRRRVGGQLLRAQEDERRRIARELHDSTSQMLVSLRFDLSRLASRECRARSRRYYRRGKKTLEEIQREIRTFSFVAHPPSLTANGLSMCAAEPCQRLRERTGLEIEVDVWTPAKLPHPWKRRSIGCHRKHWPTFTGMRVQGVRPFDWLAGRVAYTWLSPTTALASM